MPFAEVVAQRVHIIGLLGLRAAGAGLGRIALLGAGGSGHFPVDPVMAQGVGKVDFLRGGAAVKGAFLQRIAALGAGGLHHVIVNKGMLVGRDLSLDLHQGGVREQRVADRDIRVVAVGPLVVAVLQDPVVLERDGTRLHRHGQAGRGASVVFACADLGVVHLIPHVVHAAAVGIDEIDLHILRVPGVVPGGTCGIRVDHDPIAGPEDLVAHGVLIVVVAPDPDDIHILRVAVDHGDQPVGVGDVALLPVEGAVGRPVGLQEDDLGGILRFLLGQIGVKVGDILQLKGLGAAAAGIRGLGADHIDLHLVVGVGKAAAGVAEYLLESGFLVGCAAEGVAFPVVVAHGVGPIRIRVDAALDVLDHVIDPGFPVGHLAGLAVLHVVAAVGEDPGVDALVIQLVHHLDQAAVPSQGVV